MFQKNKETIQNIKQEDIQEMTQNWDDQTFLMSSMDHSLTKSLKKLQEATLPVQEEN
ncbi:MAG: hypothetical protein GXP45_02525 [bacterium]|nr:hypothetical protein [bacterium]